MKWNKFSAKGSVSAHQNKSSLNTDQANSAMRRTVRNEAIDGVIERRNKYLGGQPQGPAGQELLQETNDALLLQQNAKRMPNHLEPLKPGGSGRNMSSIPVSPGGGSIGNILSPNARGGLKPLGNIDHMKYKAKADIFSSHHGSASGKPVERFRNLEPINKF